MEERLEHALSKRSAYILDGASSKLENTRPPFTMELLYLLLPIAGAFLLLFSVCCCGKTLKKVLHIPKEVVLGSYAAVQLHNVAGSSDSDYSSSDEDGEDEDGGDETRRNDDQGTQGQTSQGHASQGHASQGHASQGHASQGHASQGHASQGHGDISEGDDAQRQCLKSRGSVDEGNTQDNQGQGDESRTQSHCSLHSHNLFNFPTQSMQNQNQSAQVHHCTEIAHENSGHFSNGDAKDTSEISLAMDAIDSHEHLKHRERNPSENDSNCDEPVSILVIPSHDISGESLDAPNCCVPGDIATNTTATCLQSPEGNCNSQDTHTLVDKQHVVETNSCTSHSKDMDIGNCDKSTYSTNSNSPNSRNPLALNVQVLVQQHHYQPLSAEKQSSEYVMSNDKARMQQSLYPVKPSKTHSKTRSHICRHKAKSRDGKERSRERKCGSRVTNCKSREPRKKSRDGMSRSSSQSCPLLTVGVQ